MKSIFSNTSFWGLNVLLGLFIGAMSFTSCDNDNDSNENSPITITKVYLEDASSSVTDREVVYARLGQLIRLEGSGFTGLKRIYINGYSTYFNPVLLSDNSLLVSISKETPVRDVDVSVKNTIRLVKSESEWLYNFEIRDASPSITRISHTLPQAGEVITIYGKGLVGINKITFPGGVVVTSDITSDEDGEFCTVLVPAGITESGAVFVEGVNGGAYSPSCFNFKKGLLHNFDDVNNHSWSGGEVSDNLTEVIPTSGDGPKSQGTYRSLNKDKKTFAAPAEKASYYWANNSVFPALLPESVIPSATSTSNVGVQMDIYVEGEWNSGTIRIVIADGSGTNRYCMLYLIIKINR
ncbi:hypothetical protein EZS27_036068 [termite gut metagenome]|uniref:Surface glycan-binding protein B xyloglucan binding domain-containing protein n=1 Tax=termite gut metagenome TaxID=433724 RepID=A0A5J4PWN2_9ZZZZ